MTTTKELLPGYLDVTRLAVASFLARYREPTRTAYTMDLRVFLGWCQQYERDMLHVTRGELEMYLRHLESRVYAPATIARRFGTVATFACGTDITDLRYESGYELLHVTGKGAKPAVIPLPIPVLRAVRDAVDGRSERAYPAHTQRTADGPRGRQPGADQGRHAAGITRPISPHGLRRTFCTTGLVAGISIRDMQYAMRHADPRTTMRYDMAKANLDRHAAHAVAAHLAGMSTGQLKKPGRQ